MQKKGREQSKSWGLFLKGILWGCLWALVVGVVLIFACSIGISCGLLSEKYLRGYVYASCAVGCFVGGLVAASRYGSRILLIALAVGGALFLLEFAAGIIFCSETNLLEKWGYTLCADLVGGAAAGLVYGKKDRGNKTSSRR